MTILSSISLNLCFIEYLFLTFYQVSLVPRITDYCFLSSISRCEDYRVSLGSEVLSSISRVSKLSSISRVNKLSSISRLRVIEYLLELKLSSILIHIKLSSIYITLHLSSIF